MIVCVRRVGTIRVSFDIASDDLGFVLALARREGVLSSVLYRRAVAEYLVNHGPADWWEQGWPVGDGIVSEVDGSAPMVRQPDGEQM